jgi:hypothetical protein
MLSTCPNCKRQIDHEDFLFEVQCECGLRFNPFYDGASASTTGTDAGDPGTGGGTDSSGHGGDTSAGNGYSESRAAFAEIVQFGETADSDTNTNMNSNSNGHASEPSKTGTSKIAVLAETPADLGGGIAVATGTDSEAFMISADTIEGHSISQYLSPLSVWVPLDNDAPNPLAPGFNSLWQQCLGLGGNAVISLRWAVSPDGGKCLLTGVPVRCEPSR